MTLRFFSVSVMLIAAVCFTGCVSKSAAQAQARLAYLAGQRDAIAQLNQQTTQTGSVTFIGPVQHSMVSWEPGLTLGKAILNAVYQSPTDPTMITIRRTHEEIQVDPSRLLGGEDFPLQPGDVIQFTVPPAQP